MSFDSSLVSWYSWSRKGCNFPTYLPTGSACVLVGVPHSVTLWLFSPTFAEEILVYYILVNLENKVRHLWWPNFFQPNPTLCLLPQQTSAPPSRAIGHAKFSASFLSKKCLAIKWFFVVLNCQVVEWADFFAKPSSKLQVKVYIWLYIYTFPIYSNLYIAPLSVVKLVYSLLTVVLLLFVDKVNWIT